MNNSLLLVCKFAILWLNVFYFAEAADCNGCIILDSKTFDRVLNKFDVMIVKFDKYNPDKIKHASFEKVYNDLSKEIGMENMMAAHVDILNNGMVKNNELVNKYNLHSDIFEEKLPAIFIFTRHKEGEEKEGDATHWNVRFRDTEVVDDGKAAKNVSTFGTDAIKRSVRLHTGIYFTLPGCLDNFDFLAIKFAGEFTKFKQGSIIAEAEAELAKIPEDEAIKRTIAQDYIEWMRKAMESGEQTATYVQGDGKNINGAT